MRVRSSKAPGNWDTGSCENIGKGCAKVDNISLCGHGSYDKPTCAPVFAFDFAVGAAAMKEPFSVGDVCARLYLPSLAPASDMTSDSGVRSRFNDVPSGILNRVNEARASPSVGIFSKSDTLTGAKFRRKAILPRGNCPCCCDIVLYSLYSVISQMTKDTVQNSSSVPRLAR